MIYDLRFLPELEEDVSSGFRWYEQKATGLGEDFLRLFYACSEELPRNPFLHPQIHGDFRRRLLRRFPYSIYYRVSHQKGCRYYEEKHTKYHTEENGIKSSHP